MLGLVRLQIAAPDAGIAAGAADHLMQELEGALGGARIAVAQAEIGVDDADQIEHREVMALGDELRADDDVEFARGDVGEFLAHALDRGDEVAGEHQHARLREQLAHFFLEPLDARADGDERILRLAFRAVRRMRHGEAAMVADELLAEAVIDQPGVAVRAGEAEAAGAAQSQRRIAAAIEEQQRLLAALQRGLHRFGQHRRNETAARRRRTGAGRSPRPTASAGRRSAPAAKAAHSGRAAH